MYRSHHRTDKCRGWLLHSATHDWSLVIRPGTRV